MRQPIFLLLTLLSGWPTISLVGQQVATVPGTPRRVATVTAGLGNNMGWFGLQAERYFSDDRLSAFLGAGYTPSVDAGDPSGPTFAVGLRGYTPGLKHRGFLALSLSQLFIERRFTGDGSRLYGPGLEAGYHFASRGGFTIVAALGLGFAPGVPEGESKVGGMLELGLGFTWRREAKENTHSSMP